MGGRETTIGKFENLYDKQQKNKFLLYKKLNVEEFLLARAFCSVSVALLSFSLSFSIIKHIFSVDIFLFNPIS
jgi:predicted nucleic acid-binding Zn finger protein